MYRTDFVKFEFRLHWEMRKSDSSYGDHESLRSKIGIICFFSGLSKRPCYHDFSAVMMNFYN